MMSTKSGIAPELAFLLVFPTPSSGLESFAGAPAFLRAPSETSPAWYKDAVPDLVACGIMR
jgi:hypothetical protein